MDWIVAGFLYMMHALGISFFSFWLKVSKVENGVAQINRLVLFSLSWLFLFFGPKRSSQVLAKSIILFEMLFLKLDLAHLRRSRCGLSIFYIILL